MFTGIVTAIGRVAAVVPLGDGRDMRLRLLTPPGWLDGAVPGASIACSGCCLTVVGMDAEGFAVDASAETLSLTTLGDWRPGAAVNLERALRVGDELGGHLVAGHVDGFADVLSRTPENGSTRWRFRAPAALARFIAPKGSVALDGVSLTVNEVAGDEFGVNLIPHTHAYTTFGGKQPGARVNLEIDVMARYVARLAEAAAGEPAPAPRAGQGA